MEVFFRKKSVFPQEDIQNRVTAKTQNPVISEIFVELLTKKHIQDSRPPLWIIKSPTSPSPPAPIHPLPLRQHILLKMFARKQPLVSI